MKYYCPMCGKMKHQSEFSIGSNDCYKCEKKERCFVYFIFGLTLVLSIITAFSQQTL